MIVSAVKGISAVVVAAWAGSLLDETERADSVSYKNKNNKTVTVPGILIFVFSSLFF